MVFKGLSIHIAIFHSLSRIGGGLIRETKIPMQEHGRGAYMREGAYLRDTTVLSTNVIT